MHGGGVQLVAESERELVVRMTGLYAGCPYKQPCIDGTLRPLLAHLGLAVEVVGWRISDEARENLRTWKGRV